MTNRTKLRTAIKAIPGWTVLALLLSLCSLPVLAVPSPQEEDDGTRRLWNKQFEAARARVKNAKPTAKPQTMETKQQAAALRAAQIEMWRTAQWAAPYYWVAFTLQGEWK